MRKLILGLSVATALSSPALAQRTADPNEVSHAQTIIGRDSSSGQSCYVGTSATCQVPTSGGSSGSGAIGTTTSPNVAGGSQGTAQGQGSTGTAANSSTSQGVDAAGAPATGKPVQTAGVDQNGAVRPLKTDAAGSFTPASGTPGAAPSIVTIGTTPVALKASATPGSEGVEIITESANSVPIYICYRETTTCSATVHEDQIPPGTVSTGGSRLAPLFNWQGTIYAVMASSSSSAHVNTWTPN